MGLDELRQKLAEVGVGYPPTLGDLFNHLDMGGLLGAYGPGTANANPPFGSVGLPVIPGGPGLFVATPQHAADIGSFLLALQANKYVKIDLPSLNPFRGQVPFVSSPLRITVEDFGGAPRDTATISPSLGAKDMAISITFAFSAINGSFVAGWSESYQTADTDLKSQDVMMSRYQGFINARLACLAAGVTCTAVRFVQQVIGIPPVATQSRQVVTAPGPEPQISNKGLAYYNSFLKSSPTDFQGTKYLVRLSTAPVSGYIYKRNVWLGGLPDDTDTPTQRFMNAGPWSLAYARFVLYLSPVALGPSTVKMRDIDKTQPLYPCTSIDVTGTIYTIPNGSGIVEGTVIDASGFKTTRAGARPQGLYRATNVTVAGTTTFQLRNSVPSTFITSKGNFRVVKYLLNDVAAIDNVRFSQKKVGRPSNAPRGKSPKKISVRA